MTVDPGSRGWNEHRHRWDVPAGTIQTADIADGSVTTPKLTSGAVTVAKIAGGAVGFSQLIANSVAHVLYDSVSSVDLLNNAALTIGDNGLPGYNPVAVSQDEPDALLVLLQASALFGAPAVSAWMGWDLFIQNVLYQRLMRVRMTTGQLGVISFCGAVYVDHPPTNFQIGPYLYTDTAIPNSIYMRCATSSVYEFLRMTIVALRR